MEIDERTENTVLVSARNRGAYSELAAQMAPTELPEYLNFDNTVYRYWDKLEDYFPDYQFFLVDKESDKPIGRGHCIPLSFKQEWHELPDDGFDWVLKKGFCDAENGFEPNMVSALFITIAREQLGKGISYRMLKGMKSIGRGMGFSYLLAPIRPSKKHLYPLIPIEDYSHWKQEDGSPFDPWLRVHQRIGGVIVRTCQRSMMVTASIQQWRDWTGIVFPGSGSHLIPGGLAPLSVDLALDKASYVEPGIWIRHAL